MLERILYCVGIVAAAFFVVYWLGRLFATGIMDGINHKFNKFTNFKKDGNKEKTE
jgi:hypothetical protein